MEKKTATYKLFVIPCDERTEIASRIFENVCIRDDSIFILTEKDIRGAVRLDFNDCRLNPSVRSWLKDCLLNIETEALKRDSHLKENIQKFLTDFKNALDCENEQYHKNRKEAALNE